MLRQRCSRSAAIPLKRGPVSAPHCHEQLSSNQSNEDDTTGHHRAPASKNRIARPQALTDCLPIQIVQADEGGQVRVSEGSVNHVEVFQVDGEEPSSSEDLDLYLRTEAPTPGPSRQTRDLLPNWEEPIS